MVWRKLFPARGGEGGLWRWINIGTGHYLYPRASSQPPRTSSQPPRTCSHPPRTCSQPPRTCSHPPRTCSQPPRTSSQPPRISSQPPRISSQPPRTCFQPPRTSSQLTQVLQCRLYSQSSVSQPPGLGGEDIATSKLRGMLKDLLQGNRARLAEAITLVESKHPIKHKQAQWLLSQVLAHRNKQQALGKLRPTVRVGLSGPPGAGKSTLAEVLGLKLINSGLRVAVLAIDPTSSRTGGSILGDKTRMTRLAHHPNAYIRPSPTSGSLGGVTRSTNEAIMLCEGAGYDIILVETVGVGQSEISVSDMVDVFLLIMPPAAGDELQGIKRGIMEVSDIITINKADGDLLPAARRIKAEYLSAVKLMRSKSPHWRTKVLMASALRDEGVGEMWEVVEEHVRVMRECGEFEVRRRAQRKLWLWNHIDWLLMHRFCSEPMLSQHIKVMESAVLEGSVAPGTAADLLIEKFIATRTSQN